MISGDIDQDGSKDVISISFHEGGTFWYRNPGVKYAGEWTREEIHNLPGTIHSDLFDINEDGFLDLIVAYKFNGCFMHCTHGAVAWFENPGSADENREWKMHTVVNLFGTGVHRVMGTRVDGEVVIVAKGMVAAGGPGASGTFLDMPAEQIMYKRPWNWQDADGWEESRTVMDQLHVVHEMYRYPSDAEEPSNIILTSYEGAHLLSLDTGFVTPLLPEELRPKTCKGCGWISSLSYDVVSPVLVGGRIVTSDAPFFVTIESLHGNQLVLYKQSSNGWRRKVLDKRSFRRLTDHHTVADHGGHDVRLVDINCDGMVDILVAWRGTESRESKGLAIYLQVIAESSEDGLPEFHVVNYDRQSINGFVFEDFDGDGIVDIGTVGWGGAADLGVNVFYNEHPQCKKLRSYLKPRSRL